MTRISNIFAAAAALATAVSGFTPTLNAGVRHGMSLDSMTLDGQDIRGEITPLRNFVLVRTKDTLAATGGGILLPDQVCIFRASQLKLIDFAFSRIGTGLTQIKLNLNAEHRKTNGRRSHLGWTRKIPPPHWSPHKQPRQKGNVGLIRKIRWNTHDLQRRTNANDP